MMNAEGELTSDRQKSFNSLYEFVKCRPFVNVVLKCILVILLTFVIIYSIKFQLIDHCKLLVVYPGSTRL